MPILTMLSEICGCAITIALAGVLYFLYKTISKSNNLPPGPIGIPFLGSLYKIIPFHTNISKTAQIYGDVFSVSVGKRTVIIVSGYDSIREVLINRGKEFAGRFSSPLRKILRGEKAGGIAAAMYGPTWMAHRKFYHTALRNMTLSKQGFGKRIVEEVPYIVEALEKACKSGKCIDPSEVISYAPLNILAAIVFGDSEIRDFVHSEVVHHKKSLDSKSPRDFIDHYLLEIQKSNNHLFSELELLDTILDLFQAGTETTTSTLRWAFLYLANNLDIQKKVHEEIDRVIGFNRDPVYEDRLSMPYCDATVLEVQRHASIAPTALPHTPIHDATIFGYNIPKKSSILVSLYSMHHDPKHWKNPFNFDPENFLDPDGTVGVRDAFMPFGAGPRMCLGMNVAKQEMFVFFVGIMQKFELLPPTGVSKLSEEIVAGVTLCPKQYKLKFIQRR